MNQSFFKQDDKAIMGRRCSMRPKHKDAPVQQLQVPGITVQDFTAETLPGADGRNQLVDGGGDDPHPDPHGRGH